MAHSAMDAARLLSELSIKIAKIAADREETTPEPLIAALVRRSEIIMDCAKLIVEWDSK